MKEEMHLMKFYQVSELVAKVEDSLKPKKAAGTVVTSAVKVDKAYEDAIYNAESEEKINVKNLFFFCCFIVFTSVFTL